MDRGVKMDIKLGEYIRTNEGEIFKVGRISDDYLAEIKEYGGTGCFTEDVTKHSSNIIDLIEVGDYVNGFLIDYINLDYETPFLRSERPYKETSTWYKDLIEKGKDYNMCLHFKQDDIKSIVTKEQFKDVRYEV